jgi:tetratricopeptide (TPR) repeat protein
VIAVAPNSGLAGDAYHGIGWIDLEQKQYRPAVTDLGNAVRLRPNDAEVNFELGEAFMYNGIHGRAVTSYREAIRLQPDFADAYYLLGLTYDIMGDKAEAMQVYQKLKTVDKKSAQELYNEIQKPN